MKFIHKIDVKQVVTEKSKKKLFDKFKAAAIKLQQEKEQLLFEMKRFEKTNKFSSTLVKSQFEKGMNERQEKINLLEFQMEQLQALPLGTQLKEGEVEAIVTVQEGDNWEELLSKSIIIKDGIVITIQ